MKSIALIDIRTEVPGAFQKTEASGRLIRTKIVTLKDQLQAGMAVQSAHLAESK
jgi:hypothetical protein